MAYSEQNRIPVQEPTVMYEIGQIIIEEKTIGAYACRSPGCSCRGFVIKDKRSAQFCEKCGHARSEHVPCWDEIIPEYENQVVKYMANKAHQHRPATALFVCASFRWRSILAQTNNAVAVWLWATLCRQNHEREGSLGIREKAYPGLRSSPLEKSIFLGFMKSWGWLKS